MRGPLRSPRNAPDGGKYPDIVDLPPPIEDEYDLGELPATPLEVIHRPATEGEMKESINNAFVQMVVSGEKSGAEAAQELGIPLGTMMRRKEVREALNDALQYYIPDGPTRRALLLGRMFKILASEDAKEAIGAANIIVKDPEVGMGAGAPVVQVNILSEETKRVLETVVVPEGWRKEEGDD